MTLAAILLKAPHIGVREFKAHLSKLLKGNCPLVITDRGVPAEVVIPYMEAVEMADLIDEATDAQTLRAVQEGRAAIKRGAKGAPVERLFKRVRRKAK